MPIYFNKFISPHCSLALWHITESEKTLESMLWMFSRENFLPSLKNIHWLATRVMLQELLKFDGPSQRYQLRKSANGKPFLSDSPFDISLSHSGNFAAVILSRQPVVGIDIEQLTPRILRITHKFINDDEKAWISSDLSLDDYYRIWTAKEALFKLYGKGELDFKKNMTLLPRGADWFIKLQKGSYSVNFLVEFMKINNEYLLCWVTD